MLWSFDGAAASVWRCSAPTLQTSGGLWGLQTWMPLFERSLPSVWPSKLLFNVFRVFLSADLNPSGNDSGFCFKVCLACQRRLLLGSPWLPWRMTMTMTMMTTTTAAATTMMMMMVGVVVVVVILNSRACAHPGLAKVRVPHGRLRLAGVHASDEEIKIKVAIEMMEVAIKTAEINAPRASG